MVNKNSRHFIKSSLQLIRFDKPIGTLLLLWPTLWGLFIASGTIPQLKYIIIFSLGTFLTRSAGCAFNDLADYKFDGRVARTKHRPLVTNSLTRYQAFYIATGLSVIAFAIAWLTLSKPTLILSIPAALIYISYPFFKRFFVLPQAYLGIAFSFGILMAFMQIQNNLPSLAFFLLLANFLWTLGYDTIYALVDITDDLKIGIKTSAISFGKYVTHMISLCYIGFILLLVYIGIELGFSLSYFSGISLAALILSRQIYVILRQQQELYFKMFLSNNWVGMLVLISIAIQYL